LATEVVALHPAAAPPHPPDAGPLPRAARPTPMSAVVGVPHAGVVGSGTDASWSGPTAGQPFQVSIS